MTPVSLANALCTASAKRRARRKGNAGHSKLILAVALGIWVLLRALWIKFTPPRRYKLTRKQFPELFAELNALSSQLNSLKIHEVILDQDLNASVVQHPRLGVLGWHKNYLILGYQLLLTLSPEEMRSVLAHELGHLCGNDSRFGGWIYRVRLTWLQVMAAFDQVDSWGGKLMRRFFHWYSPQFQAYSFALARNNEYEADAIAAKLTSPEIATRALVNIEATAPYVDQSYWKSYFRYADDHERPPHGPFDGLAHFLRDNPLAREELLDQGDSSGLVQLRLATKSARLIERSAQAGYAFLKQRGQDEEAEAWWQESIERNQVFVAAGAERESVGIEDNPTSPKIDDGLLQQLISKLEGQRNIGKVWLAEKLVRNFPEGPVYIIAFTTKSLALSFGDVQAKVAENLNVPGNFFVVCKTGGGKALAKKVIKAGKRIM